MATTYKSVDDEVKKLLEEVMESDHPELVEVGLTCLLQFADNPTTHPLKKNGYPANAIIKIVSLKDRAAGMEDCRIAIDSAEWELHDEKWRKALLSHELEHMLVVRDKKTKSVKYDDVGRPRLRSKPHDYELGGFWRQAELHKGEALEVQAFASLHKQFVQRQFNWF